MGYIRELRKLVGHRPLIFVGSVVMILNEKGQVLLQQRRFPKGKWGLPGGLMELGESTEDVARREVMEETGLHVENLQLLQVYSGPNHFIKAENGDEFYVVTVAYHTNDFSGNLIVDETESIQFKFFDLTNLPSFLVGTHQMMLEDYIKSR
ncbi:NUDIX hydrolase [Virgibacillus soli]|uniref:NUDIX hydrolase n=1 Tax=Paracerasibacillus soli TaxID=480284 RepID=A0ABU5CTF9_9BACI|nr:NUDIX hydrolase [Virgibacillus soli]MDY0409672.1 NUDIX hydrolase [Virgibacillus soli]